MSEWGEGKGEDTFLLVLVVVVGKSDMTGERDSAGRKRDCRTSRTEQARKYESSRMAARLCKSETRGEEQ